MEHVCDGSCETSDKYFRAALEAEANGDPKPLEMWMNAYNHGRRLRYMMEDGLPWDEIKAVIPEEFHRISRKLLGIGDV